MLSLMLVLILACLNSAFCSSWDTGEMEMFDLIEELKMNFYEFMSLDPTATDVEIKRAYRTLSKTLHPDKNQGDPHASMKFHQLTTIYNILKDKELRERYNDVLENGLPDWKMPVFYYRKIRKMSNTELGLMVFIVSIAIHYATLYGSVVEQRWTLEEKLQTFFKRNKASDKKREAIDLEIDVRLLEIRHPTFFDILPFAIVKNTYAFVTSIPAMCSFIFALLKKELEKLRENKKDRDDQKQQAKQRQERKDKKKKAAVENQSKRRQVELEAAELTALNISDLPADLEALPSSEATGTSETGVNTGPWMQEDVVMLVRAITKYPGGTPGRWQVIADLLRRTVSDVTSKAKFVVDNGVSALSGAGAPHSPSSFEINENAVCGESSLSSDDEFSNESIVSKRKAKRRNKNAKQTLKPEQYSQQIEEPTASIPSINGGEEDAIEDDPGYISRKKQKNLKKITGVNAEATPESGVMWTQAEQNMLEVAIRNFPKGVPERWDRIMECVPTKSKADVMDRIKYLSQTVKNKATSN